MRLHIEPTLALLDEETSRIGEELRSFEDNVCSGYTTVELPRESRVRNRKDNGAGSGVVPGSTQARLRRFNMSTYKFHSLGDYPAMIRKYGTTDSYSTEIVSRPVSRKYCHSARDV